MPSSQTPPAGSTALDPTAIRPAIDDARIIRTTPDALRGEMTALQRDGFAMEIVASMHMVVHQRLIPAKSGGRLGIREFLVFSPEIKSALSRMPYKDISEGILGVMKDADGKFAQRFDQALDRLLADDMITKEVFDERMSGLQRVGTL